jgi:MFS family permease
LEARVVTTQNGSFLASRRGGVTLLLLCAVQFLDVADSSIMNVALPSIRRDLGFSVQNLQWVLSGYLVTHGGFLLLGGRAGDLLGRRRLLAAGPASFAACSLAGGLAVSAGMLVGARLGQGVGAAMMAPAGLSILTTTFNRGHRPEPGARRLGCRLRPGRGRVPGRCAVASPDDIPVGHERIPAPELTD